MRDATDRLGGRWPERLAQRSGQNSHEESGISEGLHLQWLREDGLRWMC